MNRFLDWLSHHLRGPRAGARRRATRLALEPLEDRRLLTVVYSGGALLPHVEVQALYLGSAWTSDPTNLSQAETQEGFLQYLVNSPYMDMLTRAGYNVGRGAFSSGAVDPVNLPPGTQIFDSQIQNALQAEIKAGVVQPPDANRLYVVYVQPNVIVNDGTGATSVTDFLGYHGAFGGADASGNPVPIRYAVLPFPGGSVHNASIPGLTTTQDLTSVVSHEVAEGATDPDVGYGALGWYDYQLNDEIADVVNDRYPLSQQNVFLNGYLVQREADQHDRAMNPADLQATVQNFDVLAGQTFSGVVAVAGDDTGLTQAGNLVTVINWGDGTSSTGTITAAGGGVQVSGSHTYGAAGAFPVSVTLQDVTNTAGVATASGTGFSLAPDLLAGGIRSTSTAFNSSGQQVYEVVYDNGDLWQYDASGATRLGGNVLDASVAFDAGGQQVLDVVTADFSLTQYDSSGAHLLASGVQSASIAFNPAGQLVTDVVYTNGNLFQYDPAGSHLLGGNLLSIGIAFDSYGREVFEAVFTNGNLFQYDSNGSHFLSGGILSAGAAFAGANHEVVEAVTSGGNLYQAT